MGLGWKMPAPNLVGCCDHVTYSSFCAAQEGPDMILHANRWLVAWRSWTAAEFEHVHFQLFTQKHMYHHKVTVNVSEITTIGLLVQLLGPATLTKDRGNAARQTSLHTACEGNYANIVVELLAAGWVPGSKKYSPHTKIITVGYPPNFRETGGFLRHKFPGWKFGINIFLLPCSFRFVLLGVMICILFSFSFPNKKKVGRRRCGQAGQSQANASSSGGAQWSSWLHSGPPGLETPHRLKLINLTCMIVGLLKQRQLQGSWWMFTSRPLNKNI